MAGEPKWKSQAAPAIGSRWDDQRSACAPGTPFTTARVMAFAEGYVMARFSGNMPFVQPLAEWHARFKPKPTRRPTPPNKENEK